MLPGEQPKIGDGHDVHEQFEPLAQLDRVAAQPRLVIEPASVTAHPFELCDLGDIPRLVGELVARKGSVAEDETVLQVERELGFAVPDRYKRLINKLFWSAKGRGFIEQNGTAWIAGRKVPAPVAQLHGVTLDGLARHASELLEQSPEATVFEQLIEELSPGKHAPNLVRSVAGTAIRLAMRRGATGDRV